MGGWHSIVGVGGDSSIVKIVAAHTLPQAPVADNEPMEYSTNNEENWPEEDWTINEEYKEHILEWLEGVWEAGENEERESDVSHEV